MKKYLKAFCLLLPTIVLLALAGCSSSPKDTFKRVTGVELPSDVQTTAVDTRGFFGDGELIYTFDMTEEDGRATEEQIKNARYWLPLPMTKTLDELVYTLFKGNIPRVTNGYYFFYDQQHKTHEDNLVGKSYSYDFVICTYDTDNFVAKYYEQHT